VTGNAAATETVTPVAPVRTVVSRETITARADVRWWTAAMTLAALLVSIIAVARHPARRRP